VDWVQWWTRVNMVIKFRFSLKADGQFIDLSASTERNCSRQSEIDLGVVLC
jgi:hypothetical protein